MAAEQQPARKDKVLTRKAIERESLSHLTEKHQGCHEEARQSEGSGQSRRRWKGQKGLHVPGRGEVGEQEAKERSGVQTAQEAREPRRGEPPGPQLWVSRGPQGGGGGPI